jgi:RHS repeat-associated protein
MIHNDHLGTPQKMTDSAGVVVWAADYKPFGEVSITTSDITNNLRFPGQYFDAETGLNYNYERDYNPTLDRYVEADQVGLRSGINLYLYANANSIRFIDPFGLLFGGNNAKIGNPPGPVIGPQPPTPGAPSTPGKPTCMGCAQPPGLPPSAPKQCKPCKLDVGEFSMCVLQEYAQAQEEADACTVICGIAALTKAPAAITACAICAAGGTALVTKCYNESCH